MGQDLTLRSEKKIDRLEDRLASIEDVPLNLASNLKGKDIHAASKERISQIQSPSNCRSETTPLTVTDISIPVPFEGETGINTQSDYVRDLLIQVVGETPSMGQNADVREALTALEELVIRQKRDTSSATSTCQPVIDRSLARTDAAMLAQPPWDVVRLAIDKAMSCWPLSKPIYTVANAYRASDHDVCRSLLYAQNEQSI
jgi:hypothetical protein